MIDVAYDMTLSVQCPLKPFHKSKIGSCGTRHAKRYFRNATDSFSFHQPKILHQFESASINKKHSKHTFRIPMNFEPGGLSSAAHVLPKPKTNAP
jgi:hypothetical protein